MNLLLLSSNTLALHLLLCPLINIVELSFSSSKHSQTVWFGGESVDEEPNLCRLLPFAVRLSVLMQVSLFTKTLFLCSSLTANVYGEELSLSIGNKCVSWLTNTNKSKCVWRVHIIQSTNKYQPIWNNFTNKCIPTWIYISVLYISS